LIRASPKVEKAAKSSGLTFEKSHTLIASKAEKRGPGRGLPE
jgi:hypothetical protein